jgi:hypothetical protein
MADGAGFAASRAAMSGEFLKPGLEDARNVQTARI